VETRFSGNADHASRKGLWLWMIHGLPWNAVDCSVRWARGTRIGVRIPQASGRTRVNERPPASSTRRPADEPSDRLDSWKDVAAYLKRDVSTVQRWERREGLPVHRHRVRAIPEPCCKCA